MSKSASWGHLVVIESAFIFLHKIKIFDIKSDYFGQDNNLLSDLKEND